MPHAHAFTPLLPTVREGLVLATRRNFLKASFAGLAGLSLPALLQHRAEAAPAQRKRNNKSVILLWMAGGPSHIDTWDPKPTRPVENRGPFGVIRTALPGVNLCEHLPRQAAMLKRMTLVRSVDARHSNHEPNMVIQTSHADAEPRINPRARMYPAIGSVVARYRGANHPNMPPYAAFMKSRSHIAFGGYLGKQYDPFIVNTATRLPIYDLVGKDTSQMSEPAMFQLPLGMSKERLHTRQSLLEQFDDQKRQLDESGTVESLGHYQQRAVELLTGNHLRNALDIEQEPQRMRERYGSHLWCQQALLARRLVEAGVAFITLDLSYHTASGTWDTHGDNIPPYGGISKGLKPLLPLFDHLLTTLIEDLHQRGKLDDVLVIAMGEFGRTPQIGTQGSTDGRDHWPPVSQMCLAGGGLKHGQVIGSTEKDGGHIATRPVTPPDLAATIYQHMGVPLDTEYLDGTGRPLPIVYNGKPIDELF